ncbi:unnamed protein product [Urochloa humidicola]
MPEIDWHSDNLRILCKLLAEQVEKGNRPNTCLNSVGYEAVIKGLKDMAGIDATKLQIKNKWDKMKEDFKTWKKLTGKQTGTGWRNGTVAMDDEWWKKAKADIPGCGKFRKQPLQNEDELAICFGDIVNIGIDHWSPCGANLQTPLVVGDSQEEAQDVGDEIQGVGDDTQGVGDETQEDNVQTPSSGKRAARPIIEKNKKVKTGIGGRWRVLQPACGEKARRSGAEGRVHAAAVAPRNGGNGTRRRRRHQAAAAGGALQLARGEEVRSRAVPRGEFRRTRHQVAAAAVAAEPGGGSGCRRDGAANRRGRGAEDRRLAGVCALGLGRDQAGPLYMRTRN